MKVQVSLISSSKYTANGTSDVVDISSLCIAKYLLGNNDTYLLPIKLLRSDYIILLTTSFQNPIW